MIPPLAHVGDLAAELHGLGPLQRGGLVLTKRLGFRV